MNEEVRAFIRENFPSLAAAVMAQVRPCVYAMPVKQADEDIPLGVSKFGGRPDVPAGFEWPTTADGPCWFVAQVSLRDLNRFDTGFVLPPDGLLSFFYHDRWGPAGTVSRVYLFRERSLDRIAVVADPRYAAVFREWNFAPRALEFNQGYCLPDEIEALGWEEWDEFREAFDEHFDGGIHQFFGLPRHRTPPPGQQLLASFGQVEDRYLYYIPDAADGTLDLSKVQVIYECT
jgi:hypothetical protein